MMINIKKYSLLLLAVLLPSCGEKVTTASLSQISAASSSASSVVTDAWLGKWNGPEGTYIDISGANGSYKIIIADLDGPSQYQGVNSGNKIMFNRNGVTENIQASNGTDTGMKWLADKSNCLRVREGEGWCRD